MDVFTLAAACVRRWWVFVPLIALSAILTVVQGRDIKATYAQSAQLIVTPPAALGRTAADGTTVSVNPLGSISTVQAALVARLNSAEAANAVARSARGGFGAAAEKIGGIIDISAGGPSASATTATLQAAIAQVPVELKQVQKDVNTPSSVYFTSHLLSADPGVATSYPHRSRNLVLIALAGVVISVFIAQLVDYLLTRRRATSRHAADEEAVSIPPAVSQQAIRAGQS